LFLNMKKKHPSQIIVTKAYTLYQQGRYGEVLTLLEGVDLKALKNAEFMNLAAFCGIASGMPDKAERFWKQALAIKTNLPETHYNLGLLLQNQQRYLESVASYRQALVFKPDYVEAHNNLGTVLKELKLYAEAIDKTKKALALQPNLPEAHNNLGNIHNELNCYTEAATNYRQALFLQPEYKDAQWNLSIILLRQGQFAEGWQRYESRYHPECKISSTFPPNNLAFPQWQGQPLQDKSIVLWPEQGYGDAIQFSRYCAHLKRLGAKRITLVCEKPLLLLLKSLADVDIVFTNQNGDNLIAHDYWSLLLSLPLHCGTTLDTIPATLPYLHAPQEWLSKWSQHLPAAGARIGLAWKGSSTHKNDANRSLPSLETLAPLWQIQDVVFISLQKGQGEDEAAHPPAMQPLLALGAQVEDFADTAAIIAQLDLVICVDTAIAHLAGALNKPCWVLLPAIGTDWRWLLERNDSPWYPGVMRLFRQKTAGDWTAVVNEVAQALAEWRQDAKSVLSNSTHNFQPQSDSPALAAKSGFIGKLKRFIKINRQTDKA
jgi:tetratricopeptide (TPR) repeat protein